MNKLVNRKEIRGTLEEDVTNNCIAVATTLPANQEKLLQNLPHGRGLCFAILRIKKSTNNTIPRIAIGVAKIEVHHSAGNDTVSNTVKPCCTKDIYVQKNTHSKTSYT